MSGQLFWLCEHGEAKGHTVVLKRSEHLGIPEYQTCPGGHPVEGGEKVWWCEEHRCGWIPIIKTACLAGLNNGDFDRCRMVERFLIPLPNTETTK